MAQEFTINSASIESKINQLLPSQGGLGAGVDLSASTMVIPIVDLTEAASKSGLREDLQKSLSHNSVTSFSVTNTTTTIINTTGYFRVFGNASIMLGSAVRSASFILNDGSTDKVIWTMSSILGVSGSNNISNNNFDFIVFLNAGDLLKVTAVSAVATVIGCTRQVATITGELVNPL